MFNAQNRIRQLMAERGWTIYRLAQESGLSQTTISNIFKKMMPIQTMSFVRANRTKLGHRAKVRYIAGITI